MRDDHAQAAWLYRHALAPEDHSRVPGYAALLERLSRSPVAEALLDAAPAEQRNPMLILAALHYKALTGNEALAPLYRGLADKSLSPEEFAEQVTAALDADPDLVQNELHRSTQTNEVGRSAVLRAVFAELRARGETAVNVIDLGTSAGLNLYLDQYTVSTTPSDDPLTLTCESLDGRADRFTAPLPQLRSRVGIDLHPLDLRNPEDALWLRSCLWPEEPARLRRLEAIETALGGWPPITLLSGSAIARLDDALEQVDQSVPTVVMHTWAAAYFSHQEQLALGERLRRHAADGGGYWVACEWPRGVPGLYLPDPASPPPRPGACQIAVAGSSGLLEDWGWCHAHGRWLSLSPSGPNA